MFYNDYKLIQSLSGKYRRKVAYILFAVFYLQLSLPSAARVLAGEGTTNAGWPITDDRWPERDGGIPMMHSDWLTSNAAPPAITPFNSSPAIFHPSSVIHHPSSVIRHPGNEVANKPPIDGPGQPEMSSFKSVNGDNMVDLFSGDFSYNIPLMDVGGYPVNIHYSSGVSMDQEASWVGLGWNINPGTVSRSMRGLPDDFNGVDSIGRTQSIKTNKTVGVSVAASTEIVGTPIGISIGAKAGVFHNNYQGWGVELGLNPSINLSRSVAGDKTSDGAGTKEQDTTSYSSQGLNLGVNFSNNSQTGIDISPSLSVQMAKGNSELVGRASLGLSTNYNSRAGIQGLQLNMETRGTRRFDDQARTSDIASLGGHPWSFGLSFAVPSYTPSITMPITSNQFAFSGQIGIEKGVVHPSPVAITGYVSKQGIKPEDRKQVLPAYGYLHFTKGSANPNGLMDYNHEKELQFNYRTTPHIGIPQYTYDVYSISGEGTGGMFRPYRGDVGYVRDHYMRTKSESNRFSIDLGFGSIFHGGVDFMNTQSYTQNSAWEQGNDIKPYIHFRESDTTYEAVYFRNPGEKTSNTEAFYQLIGDDELMRVKLTGSKTNVRAGGIFVKYKNGRKTGELTPAHAIFKRQRDRRTQVIQYLTAAEAKIYGLDTAIISYRENTIPRHCNDTLTRISRIDGSIRKAHHLSEIKVTNADGMRYIYGVPAYNAEQKDVTFAVNKENDAADISKGLTDYQAGVDNSVDNNKGKDNYFSQDSMPPYAHSFLISGILSPDYVDITGNGISEDDLGNAVKFNYSRVYGNNGNYYEWRTPFESGKANYNEGLKTYSRDDKGTYIFGRKEVWYLNSIESKTMIALFCIDSTREDVYAASGVNGGLNTNKPLRKLTRIDLYVKADLTKDSSKAKPVKTVHFSYTYDLCKGFTGNPDKGKLTLDSIWFTYNGNDKGKLNPYVFRYHPGNDGKPKSAYNPSYNTKGYDRWGNYKDASTNMLLLNNADYPYAVQDSATAAKYAAAWLLSEIRLPSGGKMKITYESDDYGYVQHKRSSQLLKIAAVSNVAGAVSGNKLYANERTEHFYVTVQSPGTISNRDDIYRKYLEGLDYIYFRMAVNVPEDRWGGGYEMVPCYAKVADWGMVNSTKFWIKLKDVGGQSPLARAAIEFLRGNLPSKAYPTSELGDNLDLGDAVQMLASHITEIRNVVNGFGKEARKKGLCKTIDLNRSFIRLADADYTKYGGGVRVKRVEIADNWNAMTGQRESVYGQEYTYKTSVEINGETKLISSGVASYEPMIGGDENPFHTPIEYAEKLAPMAPVSHLFSEMPLGESFYPSASVGYSKVRVRTINAKAKSANGWQETEFFTTKDFPTIVEHTLLDDEAKKRYNPKLQNFLRINAVNHINISQGFKIELNDMSGRVKAQASYAENDSLNPISYVKNFYKVDDDRAYQQHLNNTVWVVDSLNGHINKNGIVGKDIELMVDMREQLTKTVANNKSANVDVVPGGIIPFIPIPSLIPLPQREEIRFRSAATVKVIHRYGILDSVVVMDKGSVVSTKNLVYDAETGNVLLSRTNNEFNDPVYNFSYPAHWAYSGMGMAYKNADAVFSNVKLINGKLYNSFNNVEFPVHRFFESGDEISLSGTRYAQSPANCLSLETGGASPFPPTMWAIDAAKGKENDRGIYFIDKHGKPLSGVVSQMKVLRSGKRNLLDASSGSIVAMANPVREVSTGNFKIVFDTASKVINTSAATYKDLWRVDNKMYLADSCVADIDTVEVTLNPIKSGLMRMGIWRQHSTRAVFPQQNVVHGNKHFTASVFQKNNDGGHAFITRGILKYNLDGIPANASILSAQIHLTGHEYKGSWDGADMHDQTLDLSAYTGSHYLREWHTERTNNATLYPVHFPWDSTTFVFDYGLSPVNVAVPGDGDHVCVAARDPNIASIIQELKTHPLGNQGIMIKLNSEERDEDKNEIRVASYNGSTTYLDVPKHSHECDDVLSVPLKIVYSFVTDTCYKVCRNYINDTLINPYRWGILGNWRADRSYVFYHDRKESDASIAATDIRREGLLKEFTPYWKFTDTILLANADTAKWVWNAALSQYNSKGLETENYDPLGRYNAGLYGYNQSMPVAVAQNSKYREMLYDGFEDYGYKTIKCIDCPDKREFDFVKDQGGVSLVDTVAHTGRHSIKVNAGNESVLTVPVTGLDTAQAAMSVEVDSTFTQVLSVTGVSTGFGGKYGGWNWTCDGLVDSTAFTTNVDINHYWFTANPYGLCHGSFYVQWKGYLQAPYSDYYTFYVHSGSVITAQLNGVNIATATGAGTTASSSRIFLEAGKLYHFAVTYTHTAAFADQYAGFRWSRDMDPIVRYVPASLMYKESMTTSDTAGSVHVVSQYLCSKLKNPKPVNIIRPKFSPSQGSRMLVSGWVKMDGDDCNTAPTLDGVIVANFSPSATDIDLQKTGVRIEGWQRYEAVVTIPSNATQLIIKLKGTGGKTIFADDIRVQPYNSNMNSYVYDPVNLRLMAELDANNYASFYEYDDDGTLIRVKKETVKGIMTIKETRSALLKE